MAGLQASRLASSRSSRSDIVDGAVYETCDCPSDDGSMSRWTIYPARAILPSNSHDAAQLIFRRTGDFRKTHLLRPRPAGVVIPVICLGRSRVHHSFPPQSETAFWETSRGPVACCIGSDPYSWSCRFLRSIRSRDTRISSSFNLLGSSEQ